jgi:hypothetical protein
MKIATGSDWRDAIPFETPVVVAEVLPGEPTRCAVCGVDSEPRPRTELWAFKHRHPKNHDGYVRFYCREHVPVVTRREPVQEARRAPARTAPRSPRTSRPAASDVVRAMCPDCFIEVSATGVCGNCGEKVV